jgi:geranylgeranyl pyrophosphate synthase
VNEPLGDRERSHGEGTRATQSLGTEIMGPGWLVEELLRVEGILESTTAASSYPLVSEPAAHLLKAGGKRVRPGLVLLSARAGEPTESTFLAAAAIELVHLATLYHDDVIDETDTRRGVPTTHAKWGVDVAVLAGDYLFARGCGLGAEAGGEVPKILADAIAQVCEGQIVETATLNDPGRSVTDYVETIRRKTAALFRAACELGAATSGAEEQSRTALAIYGEHLGLAFQIVDDLLDLVGDPRITGKEPGTDLKEGVFTAPVLIACRRDGDLAPRLAAGERDLSAVLPALEATGALDASVELAASYGRSARAALAGLDGTGPDELGWREALATAIEGVLAQVP